MVKYSVEMLDQIKWALDEKNAMEREKRAKIAYAIVTEKHTFVTRVREMLEKIGEL